MPAVTDARCEMPKGARDAARVASPLINRDFNSPGWRQCLDFLGPFVLFMETGDDIGDEILEAGGGDAPISACAHPSLW
jgi:hypothetical protein